LARRVVLLGASNLTRSIGTVVETARQVWGRPLDVLAAFSHGRSYGLRMGILGHARPGIVECGLWEALGRRPPAATAALLTDVGNDLLYEVPVPQIAAWVENCLDRLTAAGARVVLTPLPLCGLDRLSPARFLLLRTALFPGCRLRYATVVERAYELDERLRALAKGYGARLADHQPGWYGFDPIHIRRRWSARAWLAILSRWSDTAAANGLALGSLRRWMYLRMLAPERHWVFGWERLRAQPAGALADGTQLAFY
jgi:hypothetical protein